MPTPIQNPTAWTKILAQFGILGRHKLLLDEVVVPTVSLDQESIFSPKLGGDSIAAGGAGDFGHYSLSNPADSETMIVLDAFMCSGDTGAEFWQMRQDLGVDLANTTLSASRDMRQDIVNRKGIVRTEMSPLITGSFVGIQFQTRVNETFVFQFQWYMPPGADLLFFNLSFRATKASFLWREIPLAQFTL